MGIVYQLRASESLCTLKGGCIRIQVKEIIGLGRDILMGRNHKAERAAGGVVTAFLGLGLHQTGHHINQHPGRKILPRA